MGDGAAYTAIAMKEAIQDANLNDELISNPLTGLIAGAGGPSTINLLKSFDITRNKGPKRVGPFSHAVKSDEYLFVTGQMPTLENDPSKLVSNDIRDQTHQVIKNLSTVLKKSNIPWENIIFVRIYLVNFQDFDIVNQIYETYFSKDKLPARTCIGVTGLAVGASIEIDLIAKT